MAARRVAPWGCIWLHGLGDVGRSWSGLPALLARAGRGVPHSDIATLMLEDQGVWQFPTAPEQPVSCNRGAPGTAWFDLDDIPVVEESADDTTGIDASTERVHAMLEAMISRGVEPSRIILGGFSQGGAMAASAGLTFPRPLGGIVMSSSWLPLRSQYPARIRSRAPVLVMHGKTDGIVPHRMGMQAAELLSRAGCSVTTAEFDEGHEFPAECLTHLGTWLATVLR